jgi:DNA-binding XRE family transcriptional regulator
MTQVLDKCNEIVTQLTAIRKSARISQQSMAKWCGVSRKKLNEFESSPQHFDFLLMLKYADQVSVQIRLNYTIL